MELTLHGRPDPLFKRDMGTEAFSFSSRLIRRNGQLIYILAYHIMLPVELYFLFCYLKLKKIYFMII